jgi:hypothetical protein
MGPNPTNAQQHPMPPPTTGATPVDDPPSNQKECFFFFHLAFLTSLHYFYILEFFWCFFEIEDGKWV